MDKKLTYVTTKVDVVSTKLKWIIENYSLMENQDECIESPVFCQSSTDKIKWQLELIPYPKYPYRDYISFCLSLKDCKKEVIADGSLSIIKIDGYYYTKSFNHKFKRGDDLSIKLISRSKLLNPKKGYLKNNTLEMFFQIKYTTDEHKRYNNVLDINPHKHQEKLLQDMDRMLKDHRLSDVKFPVHRNILAARSPVFAAMFEHDTKEQREDEIQIKDMEPEVMRAVVSFIYTGSVDDLEDKAIEVLKAANKYNLEGLKIVCEKITKKALSVENFVEVKNESE